MDILNLRLMSHPVNWLLVWIVVALALIAFGAIHDGLTQGGSSNTVSLGAY